MNLKIPNIILMRLQILITIIIQFIAFQSNANSPPCSPLNANFSLSEIAQKNCNQIKDSPECQSLYKKISLNNKDVSNYSLRCDIDSELENSESLAVGYIACLHGILVNGIYQPIQNLGAVYLRYNHSDKFEFRKIKSMRFKFAI